MTAWRGRIDDLGVAARGDMWMDWRLGRLPDGGECLLTVLARGGVMLLHPGRGIAIQVQAERPIASGWGMCQDSRGGIWHTDYGQRGPASLFHWDASGRQSRFIADLPVRYVMAIEALPDGSLVTGSSTTPTLLRSRDGQTWSALAHWSGGGAKVLRYASDGVLYALTSEQDQELVLAISPSGAVSEVCRIRLTNPVDWHHVLKLDRAGVAQVYDPDLGAWRRVVDGQAEPIPALPTGLTRVQQWPCIGVADTGVIAPLVFEDGSRVVSLHERRMQWRDAAGALHTWDIPRQDSPLRIFSVAAGLGRIWGGTFIPLSLFSYQPDHGGFETLGNPTRSSSGEIYSIVASGERLLLGSYAHASVTAVWPHQPTPAGVRARELGLIQDSPLLHRPRSATVDRLGVAYFAANDSKGHGACSAVAAVLPDSDQLERWPLPGIELSAIAALPGRGQLLAAYRAQDDPQLRVAILDFPNRRFLVQTRLLRDQGSITAMLMLPDGTAVLQHDYRASLIHFDPRPGAFKPLAEPLELHMGDLCHNSLALHPSGGVLGLSNRCVFAVDLHARRADVVAEYEDLAAGNFYRFGLAPGDAGDWYFGNGPQLMRLRSAAK